MAEVKFTLKAFVFALVMVLAMQVKVGNATVEQHTQNWLESSALAGYIQKVAAGAALAVKNATKSISQFASQAFVNSPDSKASRLNVDVQRSPAAVKNQKTEKRR